MRPDWWKLEPSDSADAWRNIERTIVANDTHCRGVVLLGLSAPEAELVASFQVAAAQPLVKGFAVGRTIFADAAARWFGGEIDDEAAVEDRKSGVSGKSGSVRGRLGGGRTINKKKQKN